MGKSIASRCFGGDQLSPGKSVRREATQPEGQVVQEGVKEMTETENTPYCVMA